MSRRRLLLTMAVVMVATGCFGWGASTAQAQRRIDGWGKMVDPDRDCNAQLASNRLKIIVPRGVKDLYYGGGKDGRGQFNAPRVMQTISGDFTMTVRVTANLQNGLDAGGYNGAGLLLWDSPKQYLRLERNRFVGKQSGKRRFSYTTPLYDLNNHRTFVNATRDEFFEGRATWLRMARRDDKIVSQMSVDGENWTTLGTVSGRFPDLVSIGVCVVSTTRGPLEVEFDEFKIEKE
ncbi:MAG: DUF1349 domain-containing protein [Planctomycetota bacterium]|nr:MAG: DUF1349 domain-containing protein [Planctomycetota bacterium]REJ97142.1 MAG: DUF1349 domain-containing protein [Planctomycetota bacterium]REK27951.1 MAG: DUF1349 domain-containing protein [Planctomycetota bacterium]REK42245.1 MAG: DUF1349 domain-containing protein [Planctomycetota bacterium]